MKQTGVVVTDDRVGGKAAYLENFRLLLDWAREVVGNINFHLEQFETSGMYKL